MSFLRWTSKARWVLGAWVALMFGGAAALDAQTPGGALTVDERLDRLEKQNQALQKQNETLLKIVDGFQKTQPVNVGDASAGVTKNEVEQIVTGYMQAQEKKQVEAKKAEPAAPAWHQVGSDTKFGASWNNGLQLETAQKDFKLHIGGRINFDWVWVGTTQDMQRPPAAGGLGILDDGVSFRRARLVADGTIWEVFEFMTEVDFASSTDVFFEDFWFGVTNLPIIGTFRAGHIKVPQGLESYTSSRYLTFMERAAPFDAFLEEFDPGMIILNNSENKRLTWAGMFHRVDTQTDGIDFGTGDYAATGRISGLPVWGEDGRCLVHLGASAQYKSGEVNNANGNRFLQYRARPEIRSRQAGFPNFVDTGTFVCDHANTYGLEAAVVWGPLSIQAEYIHAIADEARVGGRTQDVNMHGWYVYASYFLTGEHRRYDRRLGRFDRVIPNENFFWVKGDDDGGARNLFGLGAWEVAARYSQVDLTDAGVATAGRLNEYTAAVNWHWNPNMRVQFNYVLADRSVFSPAISGWTHFAGMRFHYDF